MTDPVFVRYRDGIDEWKIPSVQGGNYQLFVTDRFQLITVIGHSDGSFSTDELSAIVDEGHCWESGTIEPLPQHACVDVDVPDPGAAIAITGQVQQAGTVYLGGNVTRSLTRPWMFGLKVLPGTHDIIATDTTGEQQTTRALIRREQVFDADTVVDPIDLGDGIAMQRVPISVTGVDDDGDLTAVVSLATRHATAELNAASLPTLIPNTIAVAPGSALEPDDVQTIHARSTSALAVRDATMALPTDATKVQLHFLESPDVVYEDSASGVTARWHSPTDVGVTLELSVGQSVQRAVATSAWLGSAQQFGVETSIPGYLAEWAIDTTQPHSRHFTVWRRDAAAAYTTTVPPWP